MRRKWMALIIIFIILTTGCTTYHIQNMSYEKIVDAILYEKNPKTNKALQGFKFYLPRDCKIVSSEGSNATFTSNGDNYYLYIDLISYYNKKNNDYNLELKGDRIFTKKIDYQGKVGYVIITKQANNYFLEIMHNYGKIEVVTDEIHIKEALAKSITLLSSIEYNDKIIESLIGTNFLNYNEETYNLLSPNNSKTDFLDYVEEEYEDVDNELPDEDYIVPVE